MRKALFLTKLRKHPTPHKDVTLSKRGLYPLWLHTTVISARVEVLLFEIARCLWIRSSFCSNFEKQNRKGSPQSLIYPYKGKLTSFVIKQFFRFGKVHQTLMISRLRRFCSERCIAADADQKANCFYAAVCTLFSPQNFDSPFGLPQDDTLSGAGVRCCRFRNCLGPSANQKRPFTGTVFLY